MGRAKTNRNQKKRASTAKSLMPDEAREEFFPRVGRNLFYRMLQQNKVPNVRFGKRILIPREAPERWLETCGTADATTARSEVA
jgi:excisionase family DNA binding protein